MPTPPLVYFVRHGETDWNAEYRLQGQADNDINAIGRDQADRNGARLAALLEDVSDFDFVASPMRRTRETMRRLRRAMGLPADGYRTDERLVEVNFGDWQGFTFPELERSHPGAYREREADKWNFRPPGDEGESYAMLALRVGPWIDALERPTVCVTHGGVLRAMLVLMAGMDTAEAAAMTVPQDRILRIGDGRADWM